MRILLSAFFRLCPLLTGFMLSAQDKNLDHLIASYTAISRPTDIQKAELVSALEKLTPQNPTVSYAKIEQFLPVVKKKSDREMQVHLERITAASLFYQGKFAASEKNGKRAYELAKQYQQKKQIPRILAALGNAEFSQGKLPVAMESYNKGIAIAESIGDQVNAHLIRNNLVAIYLQLNDFSLAKKLLEENVLFYTKINAGPMLAANYNNLSLIYEKQKDYKTSNRYLHKALAQPGVENNKVLLAQIYNNLGSGYNNLNKVDSSFFYFDKALQTNTASKNIKSQAVSKIGLSEYYLKTKDYQQSKKLADEALQIGKKVSSIDVQKESADQLLKVYNYLNVPDSAMVYYQLSRKLNDQLVSQDNTRQVTRLQMQFDFDKKEDQYKHQQALNALAMQQQLLQNELSRTELDQSQQKQKLQSAALDNEKLQNLENEQQLKLAKQDISLKDSKNKSLQQQNELTALRLKQFWLYGFIALLLLSLLGFVGWNRFRIRQLKMKSELEAKKAQELIQKNKLAESELKAIRSQMKPHFIFNVLNSIEAYIVESEPQKARNLIQRFSKLSRMILETSTQELCPLQTEWDINKLYTEIENIRFDEKFEYQFENQDNINLQHYMIPPMMLQPIIENAIIHGLRNDLTDHACISVAVKLSDDAIEVRVTDNGAGLKEKKEPVPSFKKKSFGIASVQERIQILNDKYPKSNASFTLVDRATQGAKGCIAILKLPIIIDAREDF